MKRSKFYFGLFLTGIIFTVGINIKQLFRKVYYNEDFDITTYQSNIDMDQDGLEDQQDILKNALEYVAKRPKYKSKYYSTGYPTDQYGVCTDVVAFSLLNAGYDLKKLVDEDIRKVPEEYNIKTIDTNIDFRRVKNLQIYFKRHEKSLTLDVKKKEEWQGGDIVIFNKHIGIVSNKRNKRGIPYVIHHASPFQLFYEEDILEGRRDIVGHYRVS